MEEEIDEWDYKILTGEISVNTEKPRNYHHQRWHIYAARKERGIFQPLTILVVVYESEYHWISGYSLGSVKEPEKSHFKAYPRSNTTEKQAREKAWDIAKANAPSETVLIRDGRIDAWIRLGKHNASTHWI